MYNKLIGLNDEQYKEYNKQLIEKHPYLLPRNRWTGEVVEDYDYSYTELDDMPDGWRLAFGEQMCDELTAALGDYATTYRISQIKEKYGSLHWYDFGAPDEAHRIIDKYEVLSYRTCIRCGKPAHYRTTGWVEPYCKECVNELDFINLENVNP